jgi:hypothetical protein
MISVQDQEQKDTVNTEPNDSLRSELLNFSYGGYSDTVYALVGGTVYIQEGGKKIPVEKAAVVSYRPEPKDTITYTDANGEFFTGFCGGTFTIYIKKPGYQTIKLVNYRSHPDQISHLEALLRKGSGEVVFDVEPRDNE